MISYDALVYFVKSNRYAMHKIFRSNAKAHNQRNNKTYRNDTPACAGVILSRKGMKNATGSVLSFENIVDTVRTIAKKYETIIWAYNPSC